VNTVQGSNATSFVARVRPLLEAKDLQGLVSLVKSNYSAGQLLEFLSGRSKDASKVAALTLAWIGCRECIPKLASKLRDRDPMVNQMAEHALWAIWFRLGTPDANKAICRGTQAINRAEYNSAIEHFGRAIQMSPDFAEAFNQRAIAYFLQEKYGPSIEDCQHAVERMPCHFGAWAGMGHCHAHLGQMDEALQSYRKALEVNPHLDQVQESITQIEAHLSDQ
jgi:tetratricopeptide (TPR) repeat protein